MNFKDFPRRVTTHGCPSETSSGYFFKSFFKTGFCRQVFLFFNVLQLFFVWPLSLSSFHARPKSSCNFIAFKILRRVEGILPIPPHISTHSSTMNKTRALYCWNIYQMRSNWNARIILKSVWRRRWHASTSAFRLEGIHIYVSSQLSYSSGGTSW